MPTPLMDQYHAVKKQHPDEILFFHLGDFYEMFYEDARTAARVLGITLTARQKGDNRVPMAGVPVHAAPGYIRRLLAAGHRVAICDQTQPADEADGLVERGVTRVITPGTLLEDSTLEAKAPNYLAALSATALECGLAWADVSTGTMYVEDTTPAELADELARIAPAELIVAEAAAFEGYGGMVTPWPDWHFDTDAAVGALAEHFGVASLDGFGVERPTRAIGAAGALLAYLRNACRAPLKQITRLQVVARSRHVSLNRQTQSALELTRTMLGGERVGSLLWVLDRTVTPMGARLLRERITAPLLDLDAIRERLDEVEKHLKNRATRLELQSHLKDLCDIERVLGRVGTGGVSPRDLAHLRATLLALPAIRKLEPVPLHTELAAFLSGALADEPPAALADGGSIREGFDAELDRVRGMARGGKRWLSEFEARERERSGIGSLKVGYTSVFGYYIEITHAHRGKVPADYTRKQTLKNAERYITPELKEHETKVLNAEEEARRIEARLFERVRERVAADMAPLQETARRIAALDTALSLAQVAEEQRYVRPVVDDGEAIELREARHPTLEKLMTEKFVPNDIVLEAGRVLLITGPNMGGKSTILRQTALIVLMAQAGSFVPAASARVGLVDKIFTRAGAVDDLARGASTFMVEMAEAAQILNTATSRSLIVLDEIGRGTSTYDGVSIAWALVEFIHDTVKARTLFATHYHELTELAGSLPRVANMHVAVREWQGRIAFLYRLVKGATDRSYGIHVAQLAGVPPRVTERAGAILKLLETSHRVKRADRAVLAQLPLFVQEPPPDELRDEINAIDVNKLTPLDALSTLSRLVQASRSRSANR